MVCWELCLLLGKPLVCFVTHFNVGGLGVGVMMQQEMPCWCRHAEGMETQVSGRTQTPLSAGTYENQVIGKESALCIWRVNLGHMHTCAWAHSHRWDGVPEEDSSGLWLPSWIELCQDLSARTSKWGDHEPLATWVPSRPNWKTSDSLPNLSGLSFPICNMGVRW